MLRIGICDDEELITKRLMRILYSLEKNQSENYDIEVYTDSVKLSEKLSAGKRYDLIFLDIMMPVKSGVEVGKIIRNDLKDKIRAVRGNCDAEVDEMISDFKLEPYIEMQVNGKKVFFSHGHVYNMDNIPHKDIDIMFYGHFHVGFIEEENGIIFANPGSISLPKNNSEHSYIIFDEKAITLKDVDGNVIKEYKF